MLLLHKNSRVLARIVVILATVLLVVERLTAISMMVPLLGGKQLIRVTKATQHHSVEMLMEERHEMKRHSHGGGQRIRSRSIITFLILRIFRFVLF